jgi:predicted ABC-type ATPase
MFAGPNGSGKSTIKSVVGTQLLGFYINPDEMEAEIRRQGFLDFHPFSIQTTHKEVLAFFSNSTLLKKASLSDKVSSLEFEGSCLHFKNIEINAYFASVAADFIRQKLIENNSPFTFETVMSSEDKIELLQYAKLKGYRTYLYYVATEDPEINISRVKHRVKMGGHPVPEDKIISRYGRSLELLIEAVKLSDRAYIFDNSGHEHVWLAEVTEGKILEMKVDSMPMWFKNSLWDKFLKKP